MRTTEKSKNVPLPGSRVRLAQHEFEDGRESLKHGPEVRLGWGGGHGNGFAGVWYVTSLSLPLFFASAHVRLFKRYELDFRSASLLRLLGVLLGIGYSVSCFGL